MHARCVVCGSESKECKKQISRTKSISTGEELEGAQQHRAGTERKPQAIRGTRFISLLGHFCPSAWARSR